MSANELDLTVLSVNGDCAYACCPQCWRKVKCWQQPCSGCQLFVTAASASFRYALHIKALVNTAVAWLTLYGDGVAMVMGGSASQFVRAIDTDTTPPCMEYGKAVLPVLESCLIGVVLKCRGRWLRHGAEVSSTRFVAEHIRRLDGCRLVSVLQSLQFHSHAGVLSGVGPSACLHGKDLCDPSADGAGTGGGGGGGGRLSTGSTPLAMRRQAFSLLDGNRVRMRASCHGHQTPLSVKRSPLLPSRPRGRLQDFPSQWQLPTPPVPAAVHSGWADVSLSGLSTCSMSSVSTQSGRGAIASRSQATCSASVVDQQQQQQQQSTAGPGLVLRCASQVPGLGNSLLASPNTAPSSLASPATAELPDLWQSVAARSLCANEYALGMLSSSQPGYAVRHMASGLPVIGKRPVGDRHDHQGLPVLDSFPMLSTEFAAVDDPASLLFLEVESTGSWTCSGQDLFGSTVLDAQSSHHCDTHVCNDGEDHTSCREARAHPPALCCPADASVGAGTDKGETPSGSHVKGMCSTAVKKVPLPLFSLTPIIFPLNHEHSNLRPSTEEQSESQSASDLFASPSSTPCGSYFSQQVLSSGKPAVAKATPLPPCKGDDFSSNLTPMLQQTSAGICSTSGVPSHQVSAGLLDSPALFSDPEHSGSSSESTLALESEGLMNDSSLCRKLFDVP